MKEQIANRTMRPGSSGEPDHFALRTTDPQRPADLSEAGPQTSSRLYTIQEAANLLRVSTWTLQRFIREEQLGSIKIGARRLIPHEDIESFIAERRTGRVRRGFHG